jgi:DNA-binding NarL/FixJ family response regulator
MRSAGFIVAIDAYLVRKGMVSLLNRFPGIRVIREFGTASPFLRFALANPGHFLVISQPIFDMAGELFLSTPEMLEKTILVSEGSPQELTQDVQAAIRLSESKEEIIRKIHEVVDPHLQEGSGEPSGILTQREKTIVKLVSLGLTNRQIADQLFLSTHTVITHRKNVSSKLGIRSVSGITVYAIVNNIITIEEVTSKPA